MSSHLGVILSRLGVISPDFGVVSPLFGVVSPLFGVKSPLFGVVSPLLWVVSLSGLVSLRLGVISPLSLYALLGPGSSSPPLVGAARSFRFGRFRGLLGDVKSRGVGTAAS